MKRLKFTLRLIRWPREDKCTCPAKAPKTQQNDFKPKREEEKKMIQQNSRAPGDTIKGRVSERSDRKREETVTETD